MSRSEDDFWEVDELRRNQKVTVEELAIQRQAIDEVCQQLSQLRADHEALQRVSGIDAHFLGVLRVMLNQWWEDRRADPDADDPVADDPVGG